MDGWMDGWMIDKIHEIIQPDTQYLKFQNIESIYNAFFLDDGAV